MSEELRYFLALMGGVFAGVIILLFVIMAIVNRITFPAEVAEIESLRVSAADVDPQQAEDVIGQVVEINRMIASARVWNKTPIISLTVPNGWDNVVPIPVPKVTP